MKIPAKHPLQTHGIELYSLLASLFERQHRLPQGTTVLDVAQMDDNGRLTLMRTLSTCTPEQLGDTDVTPSDIAAYLERTEEEVVEFRAQPATSVAA